MALSELLVGVCEVMRRENLLVLRAAEIPCSPTGVDGLPDTVVDSNCVPSMAARGRGHRFCVGTVPTVTFTVPTDHDGFQAGIHGHGGEEAGESFTDGQTGTEGAGRSRSLDVVVEEGFDIISDVVV